MFVEIIATGDEIRTGALVDSNSAHIAQKLEEIGLDIGRHHVVGDDLNQLVKLLIEVGQRSNFAIVTGGLGPTVDDLSAQAAAEAAGVTMHLNSKALAIVERFFERLNRPMSPSNRKQAYVPDGAMVLDNPRGTAPGFQLVIHNCTFFFLPGVPHEMRRMLQHEVIPNIQDQAGELNAYPLIRTISCFGLPESRVGEKVAELNQHFPQFKLGLRARFPEIQVKLYGKAEDTDTLENQFQAATRWVKQQLGPHVFSDSGLTMAAVVGERLRSRNATIAVAESCTGGLISHQLTNEPGSSDYFLLAFVSYANSTKIDVLSVPENTIERHGAVSEETVAAMADGIRRLAKATYGLAVSGIAGPGGGSPDKPVGTLWIGLRTPAGTQTVRHCFTFGKRQMLKSIFGMAALDFLRKDLEKG